MVLNLFSRSASKNRVRNERGAAMIEYALLLSLLALSLIMGVLFVTDSTRSTLDRVATAIDNSH